MQPSSSSSSSAAASASASASAASSREGGIELSCSQSHARATTAEHAEPESGHLEDNVRTRQKYLICDSLSAAAAGARAGGETARRVLEFG